VGRAGAARASREVHGATSGRARAPDRPKASDGAGVFEAARELRDRPVLAAADQLERVTEEVAATFVEILRTHAEVTTDPAEPPAIRSSDPDDDYLIALAARERAALVSGDRHLLDLAERIPVRSPREFFDGLESASEPAEEPAAALLM
jgi:predicted nucleic acid-binding protein